MSETQLLSDLEPREIAALRGAAVWYAKHQAGALAANASDRAAYAVVEREEYMDLVGALAKLGIRIRVPDALLEEARRAV